jgi:hypothetical protein
MGNNDEHRGILSLSMSWIVSEIKIDDKEVYPKKHLCPNETIGVEIVIDDKDEQPEKHSSPKEIFILEIWMDNKDEHP